MNSYQLFVERSMALLRTGGRLGLVLPSGIATDHTSAPLRRQLLEHHTMDAMVGFDNRRAIFPIHRSVRFVLCTATAGSRSQQIHCCFGLDDPAVLDALPDSDTPHEQFPVMLTPGVIARIGGEDVTIPELRTRLDLTIVERIAHRFPRLADPDGWSAKFGRELNATDDRAHFHTGRVGLPVLEGKHIEPFVVHASRSSLRIAPSAAKRLLGCHGSVLQPRLAYRDVASATNRTSLIAAILPASVVTTHSLFCLKTALTLEGQHYLCAMLNSYVANYLVRQIMTTHLGSRTVEGLRVPTLERNTPLFNEISELSAQMNGASRTDTMARVQALAAHAYMLCKEEFRHVLETFPLVAEGERAEALREFCHLSRRA
jgi:hypothetical protein